MHNQKRVFASVIALMLCVVTLFTGALAYTVQQATQGYPQPPTYKGGTNSSNPYTSYTDPYLVGYRFSCYRTTDPEVVAAKGGTPEEIANAYSMHNAPGKQLGHSINIMLNATDSSGGSRTDYANNFGQTGLKMPHMLTNAEGTDFYNKISLAQTEMATDKTLGDKKLTHSAATGLALFDYSGNYNGTLDNVGESSSFNFYEPLFSNVDKATNNVDQKVLNSKLANAKDRTPVTIYSGYYTRDRWNRKYLNTSPDRAEEAKNLYTYIYGFQYSQPMSTTSHAGKDMSPKYLTISDIDYEGSDVAPFNHNPSNIINSGNPNSWVNKNHTLIATLCGLKVRYNEYGPDLTTEEFGVYDYIIVEPIYMYYYQNTRYYTTVSDTSILQADSQRDVKGSATDNCWSKVYSEGHELSAICGLFPASFGTALYTETPYFGVDGVYNATTEQNYSKNVWTYSPHSLNHDAIKSDAKYTYTNEKGQKVTAKVNPNTHAYVFTNSNGYTMFTGGTKNGANQRVWYSGCTEMFIAPQFPIESLLGAGIFMSGPDKTPEIKYEIVYHANPNSGSMNNADVKTQVINEGATRLALYSYDVGISAKDIPLGKIASNYWTFNAGNNGQGVADNAINAITNIYPNGTYQNNGKIPAAYVLSGKDNIKTFFETYGVREGFKITVHLYAAWNTKSLVTTVNRTYSNKQIIQEAILAGGDFMGDEAKEDRWMPKGMAMVSIDGKTIIPLTNSSNVKYQWLPQGEYDTKADYYIVYSFSKDSFTSQEVNNVISGKSVPGVQCYRNSTGLVKWTPDINLFYFDFYTYEVEAPNTTITYTVNNYPDSDNVMKGSAENSILLYLPRGCSFEYTSEVNENIYFDINNFGDVNHWENTNANAWLGTKVTKSAAEANYIKVDNYGLVLERDDVEILTKHVDSFVTKSAKTLKIIPRLDGTKQLPFTQYFVNVYDINDNKYYQYAYKANGVDIGNDIGVMSTSETGVVTQMLLNDSHIYKIYVSASSVSGRTPMLELKEIDSGDISDGATEEVYVDYYTTDVTIQTQSGGNHSPIGATIALSNGETVFATVNTERVPTQEDGEDAFCSEKHNSKVSVVTLGQKVSVAIERGSNENWYLSDAKINGESSNILNDKKLAIESDGRTSNNSNGNESINTYIQSGFRKNKYVLKYVFAPYHYITLNLDNEIVNYDTLISKPADYEVYQQTVGINQDNTYTFVNVLRGKYKQSFNVPGIIDYDDISDNTLFKTVNYTEDAVVNTILEFYTVETTADNGYTKTQIAQVGHNKAYVLSNYNNISTYNACSTGYERADSFFVKNNTEYQATATLKNNSIIYKDTTAIGGLTLFWKNNTEIITPQLKTIKPGTSVGFKNVTEPSKIHWNSEVETYDVKFVFYINDVPYESLPETIADNISLDGSNKLTFGVDDTFNNNTQNVVATGKASQGEHCLYLAGMNTGVSYTVTDVAKKNVYCVYFYTLRVAAGRGIQSVSIEPTNNKSGWNGTLPYISFTGKRSATTLAVWPQSNPGYIYIDATPLSEQIEIDGELRNKYSFNRWDTKRPTKNISITYANNKSDTSSDKATYVVTNKMNHATVVQAEGIPNKPSPIDIPDVVEPNSVYYGVCVRSFTDGHITNPWESIYSEIKLSESETYKDTLINGQLSWAVVLDEVVLNKETHKVTLVDNPYKGKSVKAILPPSECFQNDSNITTDYFYSANNAYIENQYVYIDGFYYTQTIQTQVNGINKPPFPSKTSDYKDVVYNVFYKSDTINTTNNINVNDAGAFQVVLMKDVKLNIRGRVYARSNAPMREVVSKAVVTGRHAYIIPYYTVVMENICENIGTKLDCATLVFFFNDTGSVNMKLATNIPYVVMEGDYKIKTEHLDASHKTNKHGEGHKFIGWGVGVNEVFTLEYVDSGDGKFPYPVLTYTGESRMSNSRVSDSSLNITKVHVSDETKLIARYTCSTETPVNLTLHAQCYDENNQLITNVNPVTMFVNINGSKQFVDNGETKQFGKNTKIDVSAALDEMIQTYSVETTVNIKLTGACGHKFNYDSSVRKCPTCGKALSLAGTSIDDSSVVYYSIHENAAKVDALIQSADVHANNPEIYKDYLAKNGVVVMEKVAVGQYKGLIPYSESKYNLYMMQSGVLMKQPGYQVENTKLTKFVWGAPANGHDCSVSNTSCAHKASDNGDAFIWCGTAGLSNGKVCACGKNTCQGTPYSDFSVTMDKDRVYTAVVHRVTENASQSDEINQTIDYVCCSIYTNTDYEEILPYDNTFVNLNNNKIKLESATGHHFIVPKDSTLTLSAQQANNGGYKNIFNGVVSSRKTFLLSYNTVTVKGDVSLNVGINGTDSQSETWLANYAIDSGALQSAGTKYSVFAEGGQVSNTTLYKLDSNVTVKTISGFTMDLIPVPELLNNNEEAFGGFVGQSAVYYLYMLPNTEINRDILDQHVIANDPTDNTSYVIGISTNSTIKGQLAKKVSYITFVEGIEYDIILDWQTKDLRIVASAVDDNKFTVSSKSTDYTFKNIPNGSYEIHLGGNLFVTTESDIVSTSGTVTKDGYYIKVVTTKNSTISNGSDFNMWHIANIPGTAKTTYVEKGEPVSTTDTNKNIKEQLLVGTIQYVATIDTIASPSSGSDSGIVSLSNKAKVYQVKTYVNDVLMNPTGISYPVKFNSSLIDIVDGESKLLPSISFPIVEAKNNIHDGGYCESYNTSAAISFDANTNTFSIYYYTVTFDVNDASLGEVITGPNCDTELPKGEIVVAKGSVVANTNIRLDISNHVRIANVKDTPGYTVNFAEWTLNENDVIPEKITSKSHFIAHFNSDIPEYKVTLYNKSKYFNNLNYWNSNLNAMMFDKTYAITQVYLKQYSAMSTEYPHTNKAPGTVQGIYKYGAQGYLYATVSDPRRVASNNNGAVSITLNLKGDSTSQAHVVELVNINDTNIKYTYKVNAGETQARFTSIPSGKYQLYIDGIKYKTSFSYNTYDAGCKVYDTMSKKVETPSYTTDTNNSGILYVAPILTVRNFDVSHWSQIRNDRVLGDIEYMNGVCTDTNCSGHDKHQGCITQTWKNLDGTLDPRHIYYYYVCNVCGKGENSDLYAGETSGWTNKKLTNCTECGSADIRMKYSRLMTPDVIEDLDYYVYSGYNDVNHNPIDIVQDVDMAYPVYVQTVLDGVQKLPFSNGKVQIEYTTDNTTWTSETKNFDNNGQTVFYIPVGASYRIIGASSDEWKTDKYTSGGFSVNKSSYTNIGLSMNGNYIVGDGDENNDGVIDSPGTTYYVHYYTVTIKAGEGIQIVVIVDDSAVHGKDNATTVSAVYQRGVKAGASEARAKGTSPVSVRLLKDGKIYSGRTVYLSTSHSSNNKKYKLEWNPTTQRYEHDAVEGDSASSGTTYYLWADGKYVNGQYVDEYTRVTIKVNPWTEPIKWTGNCKHDTHAQIYDRTELCTSDCNVSEFEHFSTSPLSFHEFVVYHTTTEIVSATPNAPTYKYAYASDHPGEPEDTAYYYNLITSGDAGIAATTGSGVYLERTKPNIGAALVTNHLDKGKTQITVTLHLDDKLWGGQTVTIGGQPTKEISTGVYKTDYYFGSGVYDINVSSPNSTLLSYSKYGQIEVSSIRTYTWKTWTDGHIVCSKCGAIGNCCETNKCNNTLGVYCTNCHIHTDNTGNIYSCCTTGAHNYSNCTYSPSCLANTTNTASQSTTVTMLHDTKMHAVTTYTDEFSFTGDTVVEFYSVRVDADAGIDKVVINSIRYSPTTTITNHGAHATYGTIFTNGLPNRIYTNTKSVTSFCKQIIVLKGTDVGLGTNVIKKPAINHAEATTALSIAVTLNGNPYLGRNVTIGGFAATDNDNDGIYVTDYQGFVGGKKYTVTVDGRYAGTIDLTSSREYQWLQWSNPWKETGVCKIHNTVCGTGSYISSVQDPNNKTSIIREVKSFLHIVARTKFIDNFTVEFVDHTNTPKDPVVDLYTLDISETLNDKTIDAFPIKITTTHGQIYLIPDGDNYYVFDSDGKQLSKIDYIHSITDGNAQLVLMNGDEWSVEAIKEIEDKNTDGVINHKDIVQNSSYQYAYTAHSSGKINKASATTIVKFYTLTLDVYSDGEHKLPSFGTVNNNASNVFENPVWIDDVVAKNDGIADSYGDTDLKPVLSASTIKAYLAGSTYEVGAKTADDNNTNANMKPGTGYLKQHSAGIINSQKVVTVEYFSLNTDHYGGFTGVQINYQGKPYVTATTPSGANSNAIAKAFFLKGEKASINATVATNNTWLNWTGTSTLKTQLAEVSMNSKKVYSAWAQTYATVRFFLHDKSENWYQTSAGYITKLITINNRDWNTVTITGEPLKYVGFDAFRTHLYSDPNAAVNNMRDKVVSGIANTVIDVVINEKQEGGQSFVDFYYTRKGSLVDPTPDTPVVPPVVPTPYEPKPTPPSPTDWDVDSKKEYVKITYVLNGGTYNGKTNNVTSIHFVGTDITLIKPTPPAGKEFVGWFLTDYKGNPSSANGLIGTSLDHYLLCEDTVVYAVYVNKTDIGITANDIYGTIKNNSEFMTSATIVNHHKLSVIPATKIDAVLSVYVNGVKDNSLTKRVENIICPGNGTQLVYTTVNTSGWNPNAKYKLEWSLDFSDPECMYVDYQSNNNQSALETFELGKQAVVCNTARPGYSTNRPYDYDKNLKPGTTKNTEFSWAEWKWTQNATTGVGSFTRVKGNDKMNIVIIMTPENESGLRTYTKGLYGIHNYTTRSGYGLSLHRTYEDLTGGWDANKSHIKVGSTVGKMEVVMTFPEFNYTSSYNTAQNANNQKYVYVNADKVGSYYSLILQGYDPSDYTTDDYNDLFAHYTPMWLPDGKYTPVTHISGMWTPLGELCATVQQGEFANNHARMQALGVYTNEIIIKGSLYDDLYNNP